MPGLFQGEMPESWPFRLPWVEIGGTTLPRLLGYDLWSQSNCGWNHVRMGMLQRLVAMLMGMPEAGLTPAMPWPRHPTPAET